MESLPKLHDKARFRGPSCGHSDDGVPVPPEYELSLDTGSCIDGNTGGDGGRKKAGGGESGMDGL